MDFQQELVETDFPQACGRVVDVYEGGLSMTPDTPLAVPGNGQYHFLTRVLPHSVPLTLRIEWPQNNTTELPGFYYPGNHNFATVLDQICFMSTDLQEWQRVESLRATGSGIELQLPASVESSYGSSGVPD